MAEISEIKPWCTSTSGENLFLYIYNLVAPTLTPVGTEQGWLYSSLGLNEFFRLTAAMEVTHRCLNASVPLLTMNRELSSKRIEQELATALRGRSTHGQLRALAELTRLAAIAYIDRKLTDGLINETHRVSKPNCCWCGKFTSRQKGRGNGDKATVEHLWPEFLGGESRIDNLLIACDSCNSARQHAFTWAWFGVQAFSEKLDSNQSLPKEIKLAVALHRLMKVASGRTRLSKNSISLKEAAVRMPSIIPPIALANDVRYTFLEILDNAEE